jgi:hypothetical protein
VIRARIRERAGSALKVCLQREAIHLHLCQQKLGLVSIANEEESNDNVNVGLVVGED